MPTMPPGNVTGLTTIGGAAIVTEYAREPEAPLPSVARIVKLLGPGVVGVPEIRPFGALSAVPQAARRR